MDLGSIPLHVERGENLEGIDLDDTNLFEDFGEEETAEGVEKRKRKVKGKSVDVEQSKKKKKTAYRFKLLVPTTTTAATKATTLAPSATPSAVGLQQPVTASSQNLVDLNRNMVTLLADKTRREKAELIREEREKEKDEKIASLERLVAEAAKREEDNSEIIRRLIKRDEETKMEHVELKKLVLGYQKKFEEVDQLLITHNKEIEDLKNPPRIEGGGEDEEYVGSYSDKEAAGRFLS